MRDAREALRKQQEEVVRALTQMQQRPAGFAEEWFGVAAESLIAKRRRGIEKARPWVKGLLGEQWRELVDAFMRQRGFPLRGGHEVDAREFIEFLLKNDVLGDAARLRIGRQAMHGGRAARVVRLKERQAIVVLVRWPILGVRVMRVW